MVCITFSHTFWRFKMSKMKNFSIRSISSLLPPRGTLPFMHVKMKLSICLTYNTSWWFLKRYLIIQWRWYQLLLHAILGGTLILKPQSKFQGWYILFWKLMKLQWWNFFVLSISSLNLYEVLYTFCWEYRITIDSVH